MISSWSANSGYVNIDYVFLSSLKHNPPPSLVVSYDITCQWSIKLGNRLDIYPSDLVSSSSNLDMQFLVLKFHLPAHIPKCQANYSFNFTPFVGGQMARPWNVAGQKPMWWLQVQKRWAWVHAATCLMTILGIIIGGKSPKWVFVTRYCLFIMKSRIFCSWNICAEMWSYRRSGRVCQLFYWIRCSSTRRLNQGLDCPLPSIGKRLKEAQSIQEGKLG